MSKTYPNRLNQNEVIVEKKDFEKIQKFARLAKAQIACELHKEWLCYFWEDGMYSKEAHLSLAEMYVADERFAAHYEKIAPGCAVFLKESLEVYCK